MTVLVLGGAGFIGPRVIRKLVERGESVYATDINPLPHIPGIDNDAVRSARVDITDFEQVTPRHCGSAARPHHQPGLSAGRRRGQPPPPDAPQHPGDGQLL